MIRLILAEENAHSVRLMFGRPFASVDKEWFGPRFAVERARSDDGNRNHASRRVSGAGVHDVAVDFTLNCEELLISAGGRERLVLKYDLGFGFTFVEGIANIDRPTILVAGRVSEAKDTAAGRGHETGFDAVLFQYRHHSIDRVSFPNAAGVEFDSLLSEKHGVVRGIQPDFLPTDRL